MIPGHLQAQCWVYYIVRDVSLHVLLVWWFQINFQSPYEIWWHHMILLYLLSQFTQVLNMSLDLVTIGSNNFFPQSKVHGASMGPTWPQYDPGGPHVGHMSFVIWVVAFCAPSHFLWINDDTSHQVLLQKQTSVNELLFFCHWWNLLFHHLIKGGMS